MIDNTIYKKMNQKELNHELLKACINGKLEVVKYLLASPELKEHADIHYQNNYGWNALIYSCQYGRLDIVQYLLTSPELKEHANTHDKDNEGWNALIIACQYGILDIVKYLLIDYNMSIDNETMNWLQGTNEEKVIYNDTLKMIESRDLHQKLNNTINTDKINNKKVKGIKV